MRIKRLVNKKMLAMALTALMAVLPINALRAYAMEEAYNEAFAPNVSYAESVYTNVVLGSGATVSMVTDENEQNIIRDKVVALSNLKIIATSDVYQGRAESEIRPSTMYGFKITNSTGTVSVVLDGDKDPNHWGEKTISWTEYDGSVSTYTYMGYCEGLSTAYMDYDGTISSAYERWEMKNTPFFAIYRYDTASGAWSRLPGYVKVGKDGVLTADLKDGLYVALWVNLNGFFSEADIIDDSALGAALSANMTDNGNGTYTVTDSDLGEVKINAAVISEGMTYRMYNPNTGEHFYTKDASERDSLQVSGWNYEENASFPTISASEEGANPVYRVYNPNSGLHHYTLDKGEALYLKNAGWNYEGISFYAFDKDSGKGQPQYRLYNPNDGQHHWTVDANERDSLVSIGWNDENIAWNVK